MQVVPTFEVLDATHKKVLDRAHSIAYHWVGKHKAAVLFTGGSTKMCSSPQAFGWFKRPVKDLKDFKGMKCRQTGITAEVLQRMRMQTVNMPGGEIIPAAKSKEK